LSTSTTYASTIRTKYELELLETAKGYLVANKFANSKSVGRGEGGTIRVNRMLRPRLQVTASTAGTLIAPASAITLSTNYQEFAMEIWGDSFSFNEDIDVTSFIKDKDNRDTIARQMAQSLDYQFMKKLCGVGTTWGSGLRFRTDLTAGTYQGGGLQSNTQSITTSFLGNGSGNTFSTTNDAYNGGFLTIVNPGGPNYDITRQVLDFTGSGVAFSVSAAPQGYGLSTDGDPGRGWCAVGTGLTATGNSISAQQLLKISLILERAEAEKFTGGVYHSYLPTAVHADMMLDTTFIESVVYDESYHLGTSRLGRLYDVEFLTTSNPYRESVAGVEDRTAGAVWVVPVFGKNSHSIFSFANPGGSGDFGVKFLYVDTPDSQNLRNSARFISWKGMYAGGVTRATNAVGWMVAPSATALGGIPF
jgi:hypothetical protein